jgi:FkbH-like protein
MSEKPEQTFEEIMLTARSASTPFAARTVWSTLGSHLKRFTDQSLDIALCGTFTTEPVEPYLGTELLAAGIPVSIRHAPYNQIYGQLLSSSSSLHSEPAPNVVVILWRMEELLSSALKLLASDPQRAREAAKKELDELRAAIRTFLDHSNASVIVCNPMRPDVRPLGLLDASLDRGTAALHGELLDYWRRLVAAESRVYLLDLDGAQRDFGARAAANPKMWLLAKVPWSDSFSQYVAKQTARVVKSLRIPSRKVLVIDCDNTLWGGVVGEDGVFGIEIGQDAPGNAYAEIQHYALALRERGILLALVSKNNEADVWEVFDRNPGMILKREHIAAARINWMPKSENLRAIAKELNVGIDSLVLIDDNAAECAEVNANAPGVLTIHLGEDPAYAVRLIEDSCAFDQLTLTREDTQRAEMYVQEQKREALRTGAKTMEEYLAGLTLVVRIARITEEHVSRVSQLTNKTNQFNMTTRRRTEAEVRALLLDPNWHLFNLSVSDRFGDYGLTGVAFCIDRKEAWEIDTLLMSCRVLGRGVETAFAAVLLEQARQRGKKMMRGRFIPTGKNDMAAPYYPTHGFIYLGDFIYVRPTNQPLPPPSHITLEFSDSCRETVAAFEIRKEKSHAAGS